MRDYQRQLQTLRDQIAQREEDLAVLVQLEQQVPQTLRQIGNRIRYHFQPLVHCNTVHRSSPLSFHFTAKEGRR